MKRSRVPLVLIALVALIFAWSASGGASATGVWTGNYTGTSICPYGSVVTPISGTVTLWILEEESSIHGAFAISNIVEHDETCNPITMPDQFMGVAGVRSGDYLALTFYDQSQEATAVDALISGQTMSLSSSDAGGSISATMTKVDVPLGRATGQWNGTYDLVEQCLSLPISYGGAFALSLLQTDSSVVGLAILDHVAMVEPPGCVIEGYVTIYLPVVATISGSSVFGLMDGVPFTGVVTGSGFSGSFAMQGVNGTFTASLGSSPSRIDSFIASQLRISLGGSSTLTWRTTSASTVEIDHGLGPQSATGSLTVSPTSTTTYTLTATGVDSSTDSASVTVEVITTPDVVVTSRPRGMIAVAGSGSATDSYVLLNRGGSATNISLSRTGSFFTQSPTSFSLAAGSSRTITITAQPQAAGTYEGESRPAGSGVPANLSVPINLVATTPATGAAIAGVASRVDVSGPPEANPSGSVEFRNDGAQAVTGVLTSDVPWIVPASGAITIPPGGTASASFTIDRTGRSTYGAPSGSASGTLRLTTLSGGASQKGGATDGLPRPSNGVAATTTLVTIVDTAAPTSSASGIPPLTPGERALFVPGVVSSASASDATDIAITNRSGSTTLGDVNLYFTNASGSTKKATAASIQPTQSLAYANAINTVFGAASSTGTLQIRSANVDEVLLSASRAAKNRRSTMAVFRSDEGVGPGGSVAITGLQKVSQVDTNLLIQEVAGGTTTISIEYYDASGSVVGSSGPIGVAPWTLTTIASAIPPAALSAIITNGGGEDDHGAIVAYASLHDQVSEDRWCIAGERAGAITESLVPYLAQSMARRRSVVRPGGAGSSPSGWWTSAAVFNPSDDDVTSTITLTRSDGDETVKSVALGAHQTASYDNVVTGLFGGSGRGAVTIAADANKPTAAVRIQSGGASGGSIGMAIPQVGSANGLTLGESTVFSSLSDLTAATIANHAAGKKTSSFGIVETAGATITVRVTMSFSDPRWLMAAVQSRDFELGPNEMILVENPGRTILGGSRDDLFGDLDDIQLQFQVVEGDGAATIFVIETDNGSGDTAFRAR